MIGCSSPPPPATSPAPTASASVAAPQKREPAMNVLWQYRLKQSSVPQVDHLVTNAKGELLIGAGHDGQALAFKLDATGQPLWRASLDTFRSWFGGVGLDDSGNAYATAWFDTDVTLAGRSITGGAASSIYVLKLDALGGKKLWSRVPDGYRVDSPVLAMGPRGEVLIAGNFDSDLAFGAVRLPGHRLLPGGHGGNIFVAELDASGKARWARELPTNGFVTALEPDGAGNILLAGNFWGTIALDRSAPLRAERRTGDGRDYFFAKLDGSGEVRWARRIHAHTVIASPLGTGEAYTCALGGSPPEVKKLSADGRVLLSVPLPDDGPGCSSLAVDEKGMIYVAGEQEKGPPGGEPGAWQGVVKLDESGKVISKLALVPDITVTMGPQLVLSHGKLFVAGARGSYQDPVLYLAELTL